jgi:hypothetical protein
MKVKFHPHAIQRMGERGATQLQVTNTVLTGPSSPAKFGRTRFRKAFPFNAQWNSKYYASKQIDAFAAKMSYGWFVISVIVKYY